MKNSIIYLTILFILFHFSANAQNLEVHYLIGKRVTDVINKYGQPVHKEDSNPSMICLFYKKENSSMTFVANQEGVFQAEAIRLFDQKSSAVQSLDKFINNSRSNEFVPDTLSGTSFNLHKTGISVDIQLMELQNKFEVTVKARRTGS